MAAKAIKHVLGGIHSKGRSFLSVKGAAAPKVLTALFQGYIAGDNFYNVSGAAHLLFKAFKFSVHAHFPPLIIYTLLIFNVKR